MREKLTVIKVGGKIVEEEATLRQLLNDFAAIAGHKVLVHGGGRSATLQDITCDSDGKIANFISTRNVSHYLPVHTLKKTEPYYVAVFLVGAYQEILGDMHNLFGDTNAVHVSVNEKGYNIEQIIDGETVAEVLDYVQYNPKKLVRTLETWVTKSVKEGKISLEEGKEFLSNYRSGLYGYTYLE